MVTGSVSAVETPPTVLEPLIHRTTPETNAPDPSVAMNASTRSATTTAPLIAPTSTPAAIAASTAHPTGHPWFTFSTAVTIADSDTTAATERS